MAGILCLNRAIRLRCNAACSSAACAMQYVEFLSSALSPELYGNMLPSITDLVQNYHLDIEVALQVLPQS